MYDTPERLAADVLRIMLHIEEVAENITLPTIVLQGDPDSLVNHEGAQMIYEKAESEDKPLKIAGT